MDQETTKEKIRMICECCGHVWYTRSKAVYNTCSICRHPNRVPGIVDPKIEFNRIKAEKMTEKRLGKIKLR